VSFVINLRRKIRASDIDNAQESSSDADGARTDEEDFTFQLLQTITRSTVSAICFSNCIR